VNTSGGRSAPRRILVTGGCGFIGSHVLAALLASDQELEVVNLDLLTYAGRIENVADVADDPRYRFVRGDIADPGAVADAAAGCDAIINIAAETHVDRSIMGGDEFVQTNIVGTKRLLDYAASNQARYLQISTDEVYGDVDAPKRSTETDPLTASSPYAAAKAAADLLVLAYVRTFGLDAVVIRGANMYGPRQYPEKLIPLLTINALRGTPLPLYGDGTQEREFTFVEDFCSAILLVAEHGEPGGVYNASSEVAQVNIDTARRIVRLCGADDQLITHVADRPGHDRRYAIDASKLRGLGWQARVGFEAGLARTVDWFRTHPEWWQPILSRDEYAAYSEANYTRREQA
jgi:dTDP-glucose 4,6-dehydratase